jgi:hypothetical protein
MPSQDPEGSNRAEAAGSGCRIVLDRVDERQANHGCCDQPGPSMIRGEQFGAVGLRELESISQQADRRQPRREPKTTLQVANATAAQAGALSKLLLGKCCDTAELAE